MRRHVGRLVPENGASGKKKQAQIKQDSSESGLALWTGWMVPWPTKPCSQSTELFLFDGSRAWKPDAT